MNITYDVPEVYRELIEERLNEVVEFFPSWCQDLYVEWDSAGDVEVILSCVPTYHYRNMTMTFTPNFLEKFSLRKHILHEILHATLRPFSEAVDTALEHSGVDEQLGRYMYDTIRQKEESVVQDLSAILDKLLDTRDGQC